MRDKKERMEVAYATEYEDERSEEIRKDHFLKEIAEGLYPIKKMLRSGSEERKLFFEDGTFASRIENEGYDFEFAKQSEAFRNSLFTDDKHKNRVRRQFKQRRAKKTFDLSHNPENFPYMSSPLKTENIKLNEIQQRDVWHPDFKKELNSNMNQDPLVPDEIKSIEKVYRHDIDTSKTNSAAVIRLPSNNAGVAVASKVNKFIPVDAVDCVDTGALQSDVDYNAVATAISVEIASAYVKHAPHEKFQDIAECKDEDNIEKSYPPYCDYMYRPSSVDYGNVDGDGDGDFTKGDVTYYSDYDNDNGDDVGDFGGNNSVVRDSKQNGDHSTANGHTMYAATKRTHKKGYYNEDSNDNDYNNDNEGFNKCDSRNESSTYRDKYDSPAKSGISCCSSNNYDQHKFDISQDQSCLSSGISTQSPTQYPTQSPTQYPTQSPTQSSTQYPTQSLTQSPTQSSTSVPNPVVSHALFQVPLSFTETALAVERNLSQYLHTYQEFMVDFKPSCRESGRKGKKKSRGKPLLPLNQLSLCGNCNRNGECQCWLLMLITF